MSLAELIPLVENLTQTEKMQLMQVLSGGVSGADSRSPLPRVPGQDKGTVIIADDFDAPLPCVP
jgi:hypothetical protein